MHAARNARQTPTCKILVPVVGRRRVVGRRAVSSELRAEVDKRLQEAAHPDCKEIAAQLAEEGTPVSVGFVWGRAQYLRITLPGKPGGRPSGRKDTKPRKPRTNTLYSPLRDEVLRLLAVEDGISMAEIGRRLEITRQWAAQLAGAITKQEIDAMRASVSLKK